MNTKENISTYGSKNQIVCKGPRVTLMKKPINNKTIYT